jgi:hypothetical protein
VNDCTSRTAGSVGHCETCGQPKELWMIVDGVRHIERHEHATIHIENVLVDLVFERPDSPPVP